jgi:nickel-dependent lactate racemase
VNDVDVHDDAWVYCGRDRIAVARVDHFEPPARLTPAADAERALARAFASPLGAPGLAQLARGARRIAIAVPDGSRPCPTPRILRAALAELTAAGADLPDVTVLIGCGLHAPTTPADKALLVGGDLVARCDVVDAHAIESPLVELGFTTQGAPVTLDRRVADADLAVTVGVVEPHLYAGFSGGVKGVVIGCAGEATIAWTHRPAFIGSHGVELGRLDGNPFQETLREAASLTPLAFAVNCVLDDAGELVDAAAGSPGTVQDHLAAAHRPAWLRPVPGRFDVVVAGVHDPKSRDLYQASRAATYLALTTAPALAEDALVVLCAELPEGVGRGPAERNCARLLSAATPRDLVERGLREPLGPGGQRAWVLARVLERYRLGIVGARRSRELVSLGLAAFATVADAVEDHERRLGRRARVLAVADATATVVHAA